MLNKDFSKSNKEYFKNNKSVLIAVGIFLLVGILVFAIWGMNGNFEIHGYNEFSVTVTEAKTEDYSKHKDAIGDIVNSYDGRFDNVLIYGEGDDTKYVVRYLDDIKAESVLEINQLIAEELNVSVDNVSTHVHVGPTVKNTDYLFTAVTILLLIVLATIFAYIRYNGASALAIIIGCVFGTLGYMSIGSILQLCIGMSYLAMLVILNMLIIYSAISLFEIMHKSSWLVSGEYNEAMKHGIKSSKFRMAVISVSILLIGLLFVLIAPLTIKYTALNIMFMAVSLLATSWYIIPFAWNVFIPYCRKREYKIKASVAEKKSKKKD